MLRQGEQPLQVYAPIPVQQQLIKSFGNILQNAHSIFGSFRLYSAGRCDFHLPSYAALYGHRILSRTTSNPLGVKGFYSSHCEEAVAHLLDVFAATCTAVTSQ